ncbi:MAG: hypothetical protein ACI8RA_002145 [Chlamydiales bacterium]|jgi:hypothetical protein
MSTYQLENLSTSQTPHLSHDYSHTTELIQDPVLQVFLNNAKDLAPPERSVEAFERAEVLQAPWSSTWLDRNVKRLLYIPTALCGMGVGFGFSSTYRSLLPLSWGGFFLRSIGGIITIPHFIPSVLGLCMEDPHVDGPIKSDLPVTYRWVTRGDENSHLTRASVEIAYKILSEGGHKNIRLQIVTDELVEQEVLGREGVVAREEGEKDGEEVLENLFSQRSNNLEAQGRRKKVKVKSHILLAKERGQIPDYVEVVVVPDAYVSPARTKKKGRALAYASLKDKIYRHAFDYLQKAKAFKNVLKENQGILPESLKPDLQRWQNQALAMGNELDKGNASETALKLAKQASEICRDLHGRPPVSRLAPIERSLKHTFSPWAKLKSIRKEMVRLLPDLPPSLQEKGRNLLEGLQSVDPIFEDEQNVAFRKEGLGEIKSLGKLMMELPGVIESLFLGQEDPFTDHMEVFTNWIDLLQTHQRSLQKEYRFCDMSAGVMHLDEESIVTKEFVSGVNQFANKKENSWKLGQGAIRYADRFNRRKWKWDFESFQARWCQMLDSVRRGDDSGRFFWQFHGMNQVLFGAKGSFLYLPQVIEQFEHYNFDGGEATSITEDACLAFNMAPAIHDLQNYLKTELNDILKVHGKSDLFFARLEEAHNCYAEHLAEAATVNVTSDLLASRAMSHPASIDAELNRLHQDLLSVLKKMGLSSHKEEVNRYTKELNQKWSALLDNMQFDESLPMNPEILEQLQMVKMQELERFVKEFLGRVDNMIRQKVFGVSMGIRDCGWISGELLEQSPFSFWEFILQRRRWFTGLETLIKEHKHLSPLRRSLFHSAILSWQAMPLSSVSSIATFAVRGAGSLSAVPSMLLGWVFATYLFIYGWGWARQIHDSDTYKNLSLGLIIPVQLSAVSIFESVPTLLAKFWPDLSFRLVEKHRSLDDLLQTKEELFESSYEDLKSYEEYLNLVKVMHKAYAIAFWDSNPQPNQNPVSFEEFLNLLPKVPVQIEREIDRRGEDFTIAMETIFAELEALSI